MASTQAPYHQVEQLRRSGAESMDSQAMLLNKPLSLKKVNGSWKTAKSALSSSRGPATNFGAPANLFVLITRRQLCRFSSESEVSVLPSRRCTVSCRLFQPWFEKLDQERLQLFDQCH